MTLELIPYHQSIQPIRRNDWSDARVVFLCEPDIEAISGILSPLASNLFHFSSMSKARRQHRALYSRLLEEGVEVYDLRELLILGCEDEGDSINRLRAWMQGMTRQIYDASLTLEDTRIVFNAFQNSVLRMEASTLVNLMLLRPRIYHNVVCASFPNDRRYVSRIEIAPLNHISLVRDTYVTASAGGFLGRLRMESRRQEADIMEYALTQCGLTPIYRVKSPGLLSGGDVIPCGDFVLQGQGLMSNAEGIQQCLDNKVYGYVEVGVVLAPHTAFDPVTLSNYLTFLDKDLCAVCTEHDTIQEPIVTVLQPVGSRTDFRYQRVRTERLGTYLRSKGFEIIPIHLEDNASLVTKGIVLGPRKLLTTRSKTDSLLTRLEQHGVQLDCIEFEMPTEGAPGIHSVVQVVSRS